MRAKQCAHCESKCKARASQFPRRQLGAGGGLAGQEEGPGRACFGCLSSESLDMTTEGRQRLAVLSAPMLCGILHVAQPQCSRL
jgi:hypothetical protein